VQAGVQFAFRVVHAACNVLDHAVNEVATLKSTASSDDAALAARLEGCDKVVESSVVSWLLPVVLCGLACLPDSSPTAVCLLPAVVRLVQRLDTLAELLPGAQASEHAVQECERRVLEREAAPAHTPHYLHDIEQCACSVAGRLAASCVAGLPETAEEEGTL
jgi:hypothetical protein